MYNFTRFPGGLVVNAAMSGIDTPCGTSPAKLPGLPVYMLIGGKCRDKIPLLSGGEQSGSGENIDFEVRLHSPEGDLTPHKLGSRYRYGTSLRGSRRGDA